MAARQRQTYGEEVANVLTHGAGMLFGMTAIIILMMAAIRSGNPWAIGSFVVYAVCMTLSYVTSHFTMLRPMHDRKDSCGGSIMVRFICILRELNTLYVAGPPAGRLLGLVTIRRHMDRGSGRCLAEFQEDEKERPSENSLLSGNGLGSHNCF